MSRTLTRMSNTAARVSLHACCFRGAPAGGLPADCGLRQARLLAAPLVAAPPAPPASPGAADWRLGAACPLLRVCRFDGAGASAAPLPAWGLPRPRLAAAAPARPRPASRASLTPGSSRMALAGSPTPTCRVSAPKADLLRPWRAPPPPCVKLVTVGCAALPCDAWPSPRSGWLSWQHVLPQGTEAAGSAEPCNTFLPPLAVVGKSRPPVSPVAMRRSAPGARARPARPRARRRRHLRRLLMPPRRR